MELSIIVPCYRVARYLSACLDSVCVLPPEQVEILCVDDASPDDCAGILARYAARYPHIAVHTHAANAGLSAARNTGLAHARGTYVLFLDSDDLLCTDAVLPLLAQARTENLDILQAAYALFDDATGSPRPAPRMAEVTPVLTGDACFAQQCAQGCYEPMTVIRLYRRGFLAEHGLRMAEGFLFEDELFTAPAFLCAQRAQVSSRLLYRYRQRAGGIMDGFGASADWCGHYLRIAQELTARCAAADTPGTRALRRRAAQIALSIPKNIVAYGLTGPVRAAALAFARAHRREICALARHSGSAAAHAQGLLLAVAPGLFLRGYGLARRGLKK